MVSNLNILKADEDYKEEKYREILRCNKGDEFFSISEYREKLLRQRKNKNDYSDNLDNMKRLFIEDFKESELKTILKLLKLNGWTIEQAYNKVKNTGCQLMNVSVIKNI
jgi:hypothetical protein